MSKRPNILIALADDASHFGCYGHSFVKTPNIDQIARDGIIFHNAFTTNPKCAPSRASLLTGLHTWQNREACLHWNYWPDHLNVFPDALEESGYHIGFTGKGWAPGDFKRCGRQHNPAGHEYNSQKLTPPHDSEISDCDYAKNFEDFLSSNKNDAPFYFWFGCKEPHRKYNYGEGRKHGKSFDEINVIPPYWPQDDSIKEDMLDYAYEVEWFDQQVGLFIHTLKEKSMLDNTLVIVTSDNGAPFPRVKGQMYDDDFRLPFVAMWENKILSQQEALELISFIDLAPTFFEAANIPIQDHLPGKSLFDIFENRASRSDRKEVFMGRERHDMGREGDKGYPVRCIRTNEFLYVRNFCPDRWPAGNPETNFTNCDSSPTKSKILELHEQGNDYYWTLAFGKRPLEELYHIPTDSHCMKNLSADANYSDIKQQLWNKLELKLKETDDPRIFGQGDWFEEVEYIVNAPHSWENYLKGSWSPQGY